MIPNPPSAGDGTGKRRGTDRGAIGGRVRRESNVPVTGAAAVATPARSRAGIGRLVGLATAGGATVSAN